MTEHEADMVMEVIYQLERKRIYYGRNHNQDQTMLVHLYEMHKLRDAEIWVDLSDKVYSDYYEAERLLNLWRDMGHA